MKKMKNARERELVFEPAFYARFKPFSPNWPLLALVRPGCGLSNATAL